MRSVIISIFLAVLCSGLNARERIYVPFFHSEGCPKQTGVSATYLFIDYINQYGAFEAIPPQKRDTAYIESHNEDRESAELVSAGYYTEGRIVRLNSVYHISISLYATSSGLVIRTSFESTTSPEDFPKILDHMAFYIGMDKKLSQKGDVFRVSAAEAKKTERIRSNKSLGFSTQTLLPLSNEEIKNLNAGWGLLASFDVRNFIVQVGYDMAWGNDSTDPGQVPAGRRHFENRYHNLSINAIYPLSTTNSAPFICLGAAFTARRTRVNYPIVNNGFGNLGFQTSNEYLTRDYGPTFSGGGGYILKRHSDASLFIYGRGYIYIPDLEQLTYGASLGISILVGL